MMKSIMMQGRAVRSARVTHDHVVGGSNPSPATYLEAKMETRNLKSFDQVLKDNIESTFESIRIDDALLQNKGFIIEECIIYDADVADSGSWEGSYDLVRCRVQSSLKTLKIKMGELHPDVEYDIHVGTWHRTPSGLGVVAWIYSVYEVDLAG